MRKLKILFTVHVFMPKYTYGTEVYTYTLARGFKERGHTVRILTCESNMHGDSGRVRGEDDPYGGIDVHRLYFNLMKTENPVRSDYFNPFVEEYLLGYLTQERPDLIHACHVAHLSTAVVTAAQRLGIPIVATATDFWYICPTSQLLRHDLVPCVGPDHPSHCVRCYAYPRGIGGGYRRLIDVVPTPVLDRIVGLTRFSWADLNWRSRMVRAILERSQWMHQILDSIDLIFCPSRFLHDIFVRNGVKPHKLMVRPYVTDIGWTKEYPGKRVAPYLRFGFIGGLGQHKGPHLLISAFNRLARPKGATLKFYGDCTQFPDYFQGLSSMMEGNPAISYEGKFPHERIGDILSEIDVLVVPSLWYENTPVVMYEAFATRTPVIAANPEGMAELIDLYKGGWLFERGNIAQLNALMQRLIDDPALVGRMGEGIRPLPTIEEHIADLEGVYEKITTPSMPRSLVKSR